MWTQLSKFFMCCLVGGLCLVISVSLIEFALWLFSFETLSLGFFGLASMILSVGVWWYFIDVVNCFVREG